MNTIEQKLVKTAGNYVTTDHVDTLIRNYKKERWMQNSERIGKEDTLSLWLSIEEVEEFLQTSKMHGADGIRVCFGVYGGDAKAPKAGMEGKQTIALVATSTELNRAGNPEPMDVYIGDDGDTSILAYNTIIYPWPTSPSTPPPPGLGTLMIADKDKGIQVI